MSRRSRDQDLIDKLAAWMGEAAPAAEAVQTNGHARPAQRSSLLGLANDEAIIEKCRAAKNAAKFSDLFDRGDVQAHHGGDESSADLALAGMLAFWTQDEARWSVSSPPRPSAVGRNGGGATTTASGRSARRSPTSVRCTTGRGRTASPDPGP